MNASTNVHPHLSGPIISPCGKFYQDAAANWVPMPSPAYVAPAKSQGVYVVLALLLGCLGIHNFYAGRNGVAIAQLLITLFLGWLIIPLLCVALWAIIDCCVVDRDGNGKEFS